MKITTLIKKIHIDNHVIHNKFINQQKRNLIDYWYINDKKIENTFPGEGTPIISHNYLMNIYNNYYFNIHINPNQQIDLYLIDAGKIMKTIFIWDYIKNQNQPASKIYSVYGPLNELITDKNDIEEKFNKLKEEIKPFLLLKDLKDVN